VLGAGEREICGEGGSIRLWRVQVDRFATSISRPVYVPQLIEGRQQLVSSLAARTVSRASCTRATTGHTLITRRVISHEVDVVVRTSTTRGRGF
jgi:hypothetical protein